MLISEFESAMLEMGITVKVTSTGHPEWKRGYLQIMQESGIPCRYGRASFHNDSLYNVKWYFKQHSNIELNESDCMIFMWEFYQKHGVIMTRELYDVTVTVAKQMVEEDLQERLAKRAETNKRNPKKRPSIKGRHVRNFIRDLINAEL